MKGILTILNHREKSLFAVDFSKLVSFSISRDSTTGLCILKPQTLYTGYYSGYRSITFIEEDGEKYNQLLNQLMIFATSEDSPTPIIKIERTYGEEE